MTRAELEHAIRAACDVTGDTEVIVLEAHDLAASKLVAFREKDRAFVRVLLHSKMIEPNELVIRVRELPIPGSRESALVKWVLDTSTE